MRTNRKRAIKSVNKIAFDRQATEKLARAVFTDHTGEFPEEALRGFADMVRDLKLGTARKILLWCKFGFDFQLDLLEPRPKDFIEAARVIEQATGQMTGRGGAQKACRTFHETMGRLRFYSGKNIEKLRIYKEIDKDTRLTLIDSIGIRADTKICLKGMGIDTLGQLVVMNRKDIQDAGITVKRGFRDLTGALEEMDLCLSMRNVPRKKS